MSIRSKYACRNALMLGFFKRDVCRAGSVTRSDSHRQSPHTHFICAKSVNSLRENIVTKAMILHKLMTQYVSI